MKAPTQEHIVQPVLEKIYMTHHIDENPDLSWLNQDYFNDNPEYPLCSMEDNLKYRAEDAERLRQYEYGYWVSIGIVAHAEISITYNGLKFYHEFKSSIWGICSDDPEGIKRNQQEQIEEIKSEARDKGIPISQYLEVIIDEDIKN
jgi:hypothetical protein